MPPIRLQLKNFFLKKLQLKSIVYNVSIIPAAQSFKIRNTHSRIRALVDNFCTSAPRSTWTPALPINRRLMQHGIILFFQSNYSYFYCKTNRNICISFRNDKLTMSILMDIKCLYCCLKLTCAFDENKLHVGYY